MSLEFPRHLLGGTIGKMSDEEQLLFEKHLSNFGGDVGKGLTSWKSSNQSRLSSKYLDTERTGRGENLGIGDGSGVSDSDEHSHLHRKFYLTKIKNGHEELNINRFFQYHSV